MSRITRIRELVLDGLYYLTEHALAEAEAEGLTIFDVEHVILTGRIRRSWPRENKYEVVGTALDGNPTGTVCRISRAGKVRVITVYVDRPRE